MPASPTPLRSAYLRMEDGKPALVLIREDDEVQTFELRPAQLQAFARDAVSLLWSHYDLTERKP